LLQVALVTVSNGGDNVAFYVPLLAKIGISGFAILSGVFAVMTGLWCAGAIWLLSHRPVASVVDRYGHRAIPFILILLGIYILLGGV
jgi:cadmium resistance protein CadD (predicted permease)